MNKYWNSNRTQKNWEKKLQNVWDVFKLDSFVYDILLNGIDVLTVIDNIHIADVRPSCCKFKAQINNNNN